MKRKPQPATLIACAALFFSLGGVGIAASHYLISSTRQISPKVLRALQPKLLVIRGDPASVDPEAMGGAVANCPAGYTVVGGGSSGTVPVNDSFPAILGSQSFWSVEGINRSADPGVMKAYVVCVRTS